MTYKKGLKTMRIANTNASSYVRRRIPFKGNNLFGELLAKGYVIYSYGHHFPLFVYSVKTKRWYGNNNKYSQSTSKHKTQCGINDYVSKTTEQLQEIIKSLS